MQERIEILKAHGKGRTCIVVYEEGERYGELAAELYERFITVGFQARTLLMRTVRIHESNWEQLCSDFIGALTAQQVRQASFVAFGSAGILVQNLCLHEISAVRTAIYIDASTRPHPSRMTRFVDRIENALPLGLPLRSREKGFDAKPFLQRMRCPSLIVSSPFATAYDLHQADVLASELPTAWRAQLSSENPVDQLLTVAQEFQQIPAKCPQKNRAAVYRTAC